MSFNFNQLSFYILITFLLAWIVQMLYHWVLFRRLAFHEKERKENVKLVVENKKAGFATTAVIISIIALICGIGFGIAYVLVTLGG